MTVDRLRGVEIELIQLIDSNELFEPLLDYATSVGLTPQEYEEVLQNAYLSAWSNLSSFRGEARLKTWLSGIIKNMVKNVLRKKKKVRFLEYKEGGHTFESMEEITQFELQRYRELLERLEVSMEGLNDRQMQALEMRIFEGMGYKDIAEKLGCEIGTVKSIISRARERVQMVFKEAGYIPPSKITNP